MTAQFKISRQYPTHQYENWVTQTNELIQTIPLESNVKFYGAKGNGINDDTAAIQAALNNNEYVYIPEGTYVTDQLITTRRNVITGQGTLLFKPNALGDRILVVAHNDSIIDGLIFDGNSASHTSYSGRGENISIAADRCIVTHCQSNNSPATGTLSTGFDVQTGADWTKISDCYSESCGYGYRIKGDYTQLTNVNALNFRLKGIGSDFGLTSIIIDGATIKSNVANADECIIFDSAGSGGSAGSVIINNVYCELQGAVHANVIKLVYIDNVYITNSTFLQDNVAYNTCKFSENVGSIYISNVYFQNNIVYEYLTNSTHLSNVTIGTPGGDSPLYNAQIKTSSLICTGVIFNNASTAGLRLDNGGSILIDNCIFRLPSGNVTGRCLLLDFTPAVGEIQMGQFRKIEGSTSRASLITGNTTEDAKIQRGSTGPDLRVFYGIAAPVADTWKLGDVVYAYTPLAGGTIGWVCTTGGTPGTWKTWGSIAP